MESPARRLVLTIVAALALASVAGGAEARAKHTKHAAGRASSFLHFTSQPKYAAIVVDAKTGEVLYEQSPDAHRYPASITKIMTMYLAFEALKDGHLSFDERLLISPHAAAQAPSKVGLRAGQTISVRDAMAAIAVLFLLPLSGLWLWKRQGPLGAQATRIGRNSRNRYLSHIPSWQKSVRRIVRERIDRGERLHLLSDDAIEPNSSEIDHRWRECVAFLDTGRLTLRKRP